MGPYDKDKELDEFLKKLLKKDEPFSLGEFVIGNVDTGKDKSDTMKLVQKTFDGLLKMFYNEGFNATKSLELTMKVAMIFAEIGGNADE